MTTISFWLKTLQTIPQVTKEEWDKLDLVSRWLVATRSAVFIMTAISGMIGGLLAWHFTGTFNVVNFIVGLIALVFAHATNNLLNDLIDYKKGVDKDNYYRTMYGPQIVERDYLSLRGIYTYITVSFIVAATGGLFLILRTDITTLYLMIAGVFFLVFYTWPLKYIGLGEPTVVLVWGPLMIGGAFYVTSNGVWSWDVVYLSIIYALGPTSVIFGKHIDKSDKDKEKKVYTLPVMLGEKVSRYTTMVIWALQYLAVGYMVYSGVIGLSFLVVLLALPLYFKTIRHFFSPKPSEPDPEMPTTWPLYFASIAFVYNRRFSMLFLLGLILFIILPAPL